MIDASLIRRLCDYADLREADRVLEIGAGTGNLTAELAIRVGHVYAIEKDRRLFSVLSKRMAGIDNVTLICADALKVDYPEHDKVVSNMPYEISRKAVERLLSRRFGLAVLVFQKEYAEKLSASPGTANYRYVSALAQSCCGVEILEEVPAEAFDPAPSVCSAVVRMRQKMVPSEGYISFLHRLFDHRNKRIRSLFRGKDMGSYADRKGFELSAEELVCAYANAAAP